MNNMHFSFSDNELEMAMITYKRAAFVDQWLKECLTGIESYNITLSIYDSSDDNDTQNLISKYNATVSRKIKYIRLPSNTTGGYKYIPPILATKSKYIMIIGDSRCHRIEDLSIQVFGAIQSELYDVISLSYYNNEEEDIYYYNDFNEFVTDRYIPITCCGMTIFRTSVFESIRSDPQKRDCYDSKYKDLFGFAYMGYYLEATAEKGNRFIAIKVPWHSLNPQKKVQHWNKKFYECWCDELCIIMDCLPDCINDKNKVLRNTWETMKLDGFDDLYRAKRAGGLTIEDYYRMMNKGYLQRVTKRTNRFKVVACLPNIVIVPSFYLFRVFRKTYKLLRNR